MLIRSAPRLLSLLIVVALLAPPAAAGGRDHGGFLRFLRELVAEIIRLDFNRYEWTEVNPAAPWDPRAGLESVELKGRFYIMGGRTPLPPPAPPFASIIQRDVWVSEDRGRSWERLPDAPWPERAFFEAVTKGPYMYVMGGQSFELVCPFPGCTPDQQFPVSRFYNDVYRSSDGIDWELLTESAPWEGRAGLSAVVHRGWIYVFGGGRGDDVCIGGSGREFFRDVHKSRDGIHWIEVTDEAPWPGRGGGAAVSKNGWIYYIGGEEGFGLDPFGDVWASRRGERWVKLNDEAFEPRSGHKCGVLTDTIVCFGGFNLDGNPMDVQISRDGKRWHALDPNGPAAPPWLAEMAEDIKYDFDIIVKKSRHASRRGIYTFGGDREVFEDCSAGPPDPPGPPGPPGPPFAAASSSEGGPPEIPDFDLRVDNDVWRFSPPRRWHPHGRETERRSRDD